MCHSHRFPLATDIDVYIVQVDYGRHGIAWQETPVEHQSRDACIAYLRSMSDDLHVTRVVWLNLEEGRCADVTKDILAKADWFDEPDDNEAGSALDNAAARGDHIHQEHKEAVR